MDEFALFRWKSNGVVESLPTSYAAHPVFGDNLEPYMFDEDEYEEDKVVQGHEVPVDQRAKVTATPVKKNTKDKPTSEDRA